MKPKTKIQEQIYYHLMGDLPLLTVTQEQWAYQHCLKHLAFRTKNKTSCLDCGHVWPTASNKTLLAKLVDTTCKCPACGTKLEIKDTLHRTHNQREFLCVLNTIENWQVVRHFELRSVHETKRKAMHYLKEIAQIWLNPADKKEEVVARLCGNMGWGDNYHSELEIRNRNAIQDDYDLMPTAILPRGKVLPLYKRNGFKGDFKTMSPYGMFHLLATSPIAETLLKTGKYDNLFRMMWSRYDTEIIKRWPTIKIAIRNGYQIDDPSIWFDYLDLLERYDKDLLNASYVCPADLREAHNEYVRRKRQEDEERRNEQAQVQRLKDAEKERRASLTPAQLQEEYVQAKGVYFGISFADENICIAVIKSVEEIKAEGEILDHCVYTNDYHGKPDSLLLSARIDGKPIETVEVSLSDMKVVQCRGYDNKPTPYHDQIVKAVTSNLHLVRKAYQKASKQQKIAA